MRLFLLGVEVVALPDVPYEVAQDAGEVMVAAATGRGRLTELAAADDATESLMRGIPPEGGAAPKRGARILGQTS